MKKHLLFVIFMLFLPFFSTFIVCNPAFQVTEAQKKWFDNLEKEWIEPFKKLTKLDDQEMRLVLGTISDMKKQRFDYLFKAENLEYFHDENIPKEVMQKTYKILEKHGINPYRIDIKTNKKEKDLAAAGDDPSIFKHIKQDNTVFFSFRYEQQNPTLWINEQSYKRNDDFFENTILHEFGHLSEAHRGQRLFLSAILKEKNISKEDREKFFKRFTYSIEFIADQRLTINNKKIIENMIKEYGKSEEVKKLLSTTSIDDLKIIYEGSYPSDLARWLSLTKMKQTMYNA